MRIGRLLIRWISPEEMLAIRARKQGVPGATFEYADIPVYNAEGKLCRITGFTEAGVQWVEGQFGTCKHNLRWDWALRSDPNLNDFPSLLPEFQNAYERIKAIRRARTEYSETTDKLRQILR